LVINDDYDVMDDDDDDDDKNDDGVDGVVCFFLNF